MLLYFLIDLFLQIPIDLSDLLLIVIVALLGLYQRFLDLFPCVFDIALCFSKDCLSVLVLIEDPLLVADGRREQIYLRLSLLHSDLVLVG